MNGYGNSVFLRTAWEVSGGVPPVNTVAPAITGTAQEGQIVTCSTGTWTGTPTITFAYQWKRNGSNIGSATNSTYTLVTADVSQSITCQVTATNGAGSANATSNTITPTAAVDPDAQAFITAAAITNPTQQAAINTLVVSLKGYNVWSKMKASYPFVTDKTVEADIKSQMKFNLKDPRDLDVAFRLLWNGGGSWTANGYTPNGINGFADTKLNSSTNLTNSNNHLSLYSRTSSIVGATVEMGCANTTALNFLHLRTAVNFVSGDLTITNFTSITNAQGFWIGNKRDNNDRRVYKNSTKENTNTTLNSTAYPNLNLYLGARNDNNSAAVYSNKQTAFASIGDGLTDTEAANFYTAVQTFQTTLGRQI